jgi:DnaK suppressor protein
MDSDRARELLRRERARIEKTFAERAELDDGELTTRDQHLGDQATDLSDDELSAGLREQLTEHLAAVDRAEQRLAAGTYGLRSRAASRSRTSGWRRTRQPNEPPKTRRDSSGSG